MKSVVSTKEQCYKCGFKVITTDFEHLYLVLHLDTFCTRFIFITFLWNLFDYDTGEPRESIFFHDFPMDMYSISPVLVGWPLMGI